MRGGGYTGRAKGHDDEAAAEARRRLQAALGMSMSGDSAAAGAGASVPSASASGGQGQHSLTGGGSTSTAAAAALATSATPQLQSPLVFAAVGSPTSGAGAPFPSLHPQFSALGASAQPRTSWTGAAAQPQNDEAQFNQLSSLFQDPNISNFQRAQLEAQMQAQVQAQTQAQLRMRAMLEQEAAQTEEQLRILRLQRQQRQQQDEMLLRAAYFAGIQPTSMAHLNQLLSSVGSQPGTTSGIFPSTTASSVPPPVGQATQGALPGSAALVGDSGAGLLSLSSSAFSRMAGASSSAVSEALPSTDSHGNVRLSLTNTLRQEPVAGFFLHQQSGGTLQESKEQAWVEEKEDRVRDEDMKDDEDHRVGGQEKQGDGISDDEYFRTHKNPREVQPSPGDAAGSRGRTVRRSREAFPLKLYRILHEAEKNGQGDIVSFFPHGRAFAVHKPKEFINEIMPKYFGAGRMNTFLKQLNLYEFRRITEGPDKGGYYHPKFARGKRHMCKIIRRKKTNGPKGEEKAEGDDDDDASGRHTPAQSDTSAREESKAAMYPGSSVSGNSVGPSSLSMLKAKKSSPGRDDEEEKLPSRRGAKKKTS